jgi:hypothetical protein
MDVKTTVVRERGPYSKGWTVKSWPTTYLCCSDCIALMDRAGAIQEKFMKGKFRAARNGRYGRVKIKFDEMIVWHKTYQWMRLMLSQNSNSAVG